MRGAAVVFLFAFATAPRAGWAQGGVPIGPEFRVNTFTTGFQGVPSVSADPEARFVIVWQSNGQDGSGSGVFGQSFFVPGQPQGPEFRVNTYTTGDQYDPSAAQIAGGNFVVVWTSTGQDGYSTSIFGQRFVSSGAPAGPEFLVNTYTSGSQLEPAVAVDTVGNFVVIWASVGQLEPGVASDVFAQRYTALGSPIGPEFRVNTYTTGYQYRPAVAAAWSGKFVVVWQDGLAAGGPGRGVFGQRFDSSGVPLGPEFQVDTYPTGFQGFPSVAADADGDFVVVWHSDGEDGSDLGVFGQRYSSAGDPLGPEFPVNTHTTGAQAFPAVTSDGSGDFVVLWQDNSQEDGSGGGVFGQRFASTGIPAGSEFRVNTYTTGLQNRPSVGSIGGGTFIVAWGSDGQDGSSYGVFAQRYSTIVPVELMRFGVE